MPPPTTNRPQASAPPTPPPATQGDEDPQSPTVMLQAYLRSRGMPLTSDNMRRVLMANAQGSTLIPGLENMTPGTDPAVGQPGNVAGKIEQAPTRSNIPLPPDYVPPPPAAAANAPQDSTGGLPNVSLGNLGALIAAGAGAGTGMWLGSRGGGPEPARVGDTTVNVGDTSAQPALPAQTGDRFAIGAQDRPAIGGPNVNVGALPAPAAALPAPQQALPAPAGGSAADAINAATSAPDPLQAALARAVQPRLPPPPLALPAPPTPAATGPGTSVPLPGPAAPPTAAAGPPRLQPVPGGNGLMVDTRTGEFIQPNAAVRALQPPVRVAPGAVRAPRLRLRMP